MNYMYLGPRIPGVVKRNQIFTYEPTEVMEKVKAIYSEAGILFVKMDETTIGEYRRQVKTQGTRLYQTYKKVKSNLKAT